MDHEEGRRHPFDPILPSEPTSPDERSAYSELGLDLPRVVDAGWHAAQFDRHVSGPDQAAGSARDRVDRNEDRPTPLRDVVETRPPATEAIAVRPLPDLDALTAALASLEKQISRAGREQFKASTLAEAQRDQLQVVLEALRTAEAARDDELTALRERGNTIASQARREVARAILPAVDGLEGALHSGKHLLAVSAPPAPRRAWWRRAPTTPAPEAGLRGDLWAWLSGLEFVHERLLSVLAAEDIVPIAALGLPFDPHIHLAVEVSRPGSAAPAGTITAVIRQGYLIGGRVLRPAEVAVARAD
jgi:molecular chaperone GrpE (heat shock protein)